MFLNELDDEQKMAFMELAHLVAKADGIVGLEEKHLLSTYLYEMHMKDTTYEPEGLDLENILRHFSEKKSRMIAYIEIMALVYSDRDFSKEERTLTDTIAASFRITDEEKSDIKKWLRRLNQVYVEGYELVNG